MSFNDYILKVGINILKDDYFKDKLDYYEYKAIHQHPNANDMYIIILIDQKISFIKIFDKTDKFFTNKQINKFMYNDHKLNINNKCDCLHYNDTLQFNKNKLIFSSMFIGQVKLFNQTVYNLDKYQMMQFKEEFKKLKLFND